MYMKSELMPAEQWEVTEGAVTDGMMSVAQKAVESNSVSVGGIVEKAIERGFTRIQVTRIVEIEFDTGEE